MNKLLRAEIWEIQVILYLILAQLVQTQWIKWGLWAWCVITFFGSLNLIRQHRRDTQSSQHKEGE